MTEEVKMKKYYVIYKQAGHTNIEHQWFETEAEANEFKENAIAEGCEAVVRVKN
mgnify:CR=1 FL=1